MDWREVGKKLREQRHQKTAEYAEKDCGTVVGTPEGPVLLPDDYYHKDMDPIFRGVLWAHFYRNDEDPSPLIEYLLSDRPLGPVERKHLAAVLATLTNPSDSVSTGRPQDTVLRLAATMACVIYETWREVNCKHGVSDRGHRGDMKDIAAEEVVEDYFAWRFTTNLDEFRLAGDADTFTEAVRELMDRPKERRDTGDPIPVTFPLRQKS